MFQISASKSEKLRFSYQIESEEAGHAYLYLIKNDLHDKPYGLLEDVFVEEKYRKQGVGTELVKKVIEEAKKLDCYKLICTSREERNLQSWYEKFGFKKHGVEFRIELIG